MPWIKVSDNPPDAAGWLHCDGCGHLTSKPNPVDSSEIVDPCIYCGTDYQQATAEDMRLAYPHGQFVWRKETVNES